MPPLQAWHVLKNETADIKSKISASGCLDPGLACTRQVIVTGCTWPYYSCFLGVALFDARNIGPGAAQGVRRCAFSHTTHPTLPAPQPCVSTQAGSTLPNAAGFSASVAWALPSPL